LYCIKPKVTDEEEEDDDVFFCLLFFIRMLIQFCVILQFPCRHIIMTELQATPQGQHSLKIMMPLRDYHCKWQNVYFELSLFSVNVS